jgi:hypothetical protein
LPRVNARVRFALIASATLPSRRKEEVLDQGDAKDEMRERQSKRRAKPLELAGRAYVSLARVRSSSELGC